MRNDRRATVALVAIVGLAAVAVLTVFAMGVRHVPSYPDLAEQPQPAPGGTIAYSTYEDRVGRCLWVQDLGGAPRRFGCDQDPGVPVPGGYISSFGFDTAGHLALARYGSDVGETGNTVTIITYDTATFAELSRRTESIGKTPPDRTVRADGARVSLLAGRRDGAWKVQVTDAGATRTVLSLSGPDDYYLWNVAWSDDGNWILVSDSTQRYLVMSATGDPQPRILTRDAAEVVWYQPVQS